MCEEYVKVSVIIPVYNMEKYLRECLDSVFGQSLHKIEVICIDDGSTDDTKEILEEYHDRFENMVVVFQDREGAGLARNKGLDIAKGEFVAFMDSDDYYPSEDVLEYLYKNAKKNNANIAGGSLLRNVASNIYDYGDTRCIITEEMKVSLSDYPCYAGFYRYIYKTSFLKDNNICFPDLVRFQDPPFLLESFAKAKQIWLGPKYTYVYREFDKKIDFSSKKVVCDIAKGYLLMLRHLCANGYAQLQENITKQMLNSYDLFAIHFCEGNNNLKYILNDIKKIIKNENEKEEFCRIWNEDKFIKRYSEIRNSIIALSHKIRCCKKFIIYGAGRYGKISYDYFSNLNDVTFLGFAATEVNEICTVRGHIVKRIEEYSDDTEALVIISIQNDINNQMKENVSKLGFKNISYFNFTNCFVEFERLNDGRFAFDN